MTTFGIIFFILLTFIGALVMMFYTDFCGEGVGSDFEYKVVAYLLSLLPSLLLVFLFFLLFYLINLSTSTNVDGGNTSTYTEIKSIALKENVSGSFVLGCGSIHGSDYYYFVKNTKYGYQVKKELIDDNVYIKEDGNNVPYIEYVQNIEISVQTKFFDLFFKNKADTFYYDAATIFHLPKGSIVQNYKVDINNIQ